MFILEKEGIFRKLTLVGLLLAMLGPWSFDLVSVPAQFPCDGPPVRLVGDFCGFPVSGFGGLLMVSVNLFRIPGELIKENNIALFFPELQALLVLWIIFLPLLSALSLIRRRSRQLQIVHLVVCVLGIFAAILVFAMQAMRPQVAPFLYLVWGSWLYILVAMGAIIVEMFVFYKRQSISNRLSP